MDNHAHPARALDRRGLDISRTWNVHRCLASLQVVMFAALFLVLSNLVSPNSGRSQVICGTTGCDDFSLYDSTSTGCYRVKIVTRNSTLGRIDKFRIWTPQTQNALDWLCSITLDTTGTNHHGPSKFLTGYWTEDYGAKTNFSRTFEDGPGHNNTGDLLPCDSGWIQLCVCCGGGSLSLPFYITTYHWNPSTLTYDSCTSSLLNPAWYSRPCGGGSYGCDKTCDQLGAVVSTNALTGETQVCFTITRLIAGSLKGFNLQFQWPTGCNPHNMALISAPSGWTLDALSTSGATMHASLPSNAIANCASASFCFALRDCAEPGTLCTSLTAILHDDDDGGVCTTSTTVTLPDYDNACCPISGVVGNHTTATQSPTTGKWTFCFDFHVTGTTVFDHIKINLNVTGLGRCLQVTSVPLGWHEDPTSPGDYYADVPGLTGCRTYVWCVTTCDCQSSTAFENRIGITGDALGSFKENFGPDNGSCCDGVWRTNDYMTIRTVNASCVDVVMHNTHWDNGCCAITSFSFTIPDGCSPTITVPTGWSYTISSTLPRTVTVGGVISSNKIACCDSLTVRVCSSDCGLGITSWLSSWTTTDECSHIHFGNSEHTGGALKHSSGGSVPKSESFAGNSDPIEESNFPNPFGVGTGFTTTIPFTTTTQGTAYIHVVDENGKVVLSDNQQVTYSGKHFFYFTADELPAGRYFYQIEFPKGKVIVSRSMLMVK